MPEAGDVLCGRYVLESQLGKGGMGTVWLGRDEKLGREVAIKVLHSDSTDREWVARFKREARVMAMLKHPNIVVVHDLGEDQGAAFLVMERLPGPNLGEILRRQQPLPPVSWVVAYGKQVATALAFLHGAAAPVVHRDVKPQNLVLDEGGVLKLCDFGIAALPTMDLSRYTATGMPIGTIVYMSPEQVNAFEVGPASDVYSFGVVLYEMLAGVLPFRLDNGLHAYALQAVNVQPRPIEDHRPDVPPELAELIHAMLAKGAADRPGTTAVGATLSALGGGERGELREEAKILAELDRIHAKLQAGRGAEAGMRLIRLTERAQTTLGPDHETTRRIQSFGELSRGP
ncbi:serine/threonine-protein kinase [Nonomuraea sp. NPDC046570]|uniref:serine/threonine-protein kinase n=1 Tax=Nonomuraea sp. NPDC046570 TaxID=3155255 RepID=UPI0033CB9D6B